MIINKCHTCKGIGMIRSGSFVISGKRYRKLITCKTCKGFGALIKHRSTL